MYEAILIDAIVAMLGVVAIVALMFALLPPRRKS